MLSPIMNSMLTIGLLFSSAANAQIEGAYTIENTKYPDVYPLCLESLIGSTASHVKTVTLEVENSDLWMKFSPTEIQRFPDANDFASGKVPFGCANWKCRIGVRQRDGSYKRTERTLSAFGVYSVDLKLSESEADTLNFTATGKGRFVFGSNALTKECVLRKVLE